MFFLGGPNFSTDVDALVEEIQKAEPLITASRTEQVRLLVQRLQAKLGQNGSHVFYLFKVRRCSGWLVGQLVTAGISSKTLTSTGMFNHPRQKKFHKVPGVSLLLNIVFCFPEKNFFNKNSYVAFASHFIYICYT